MRGPNLRAKQLWLKTVHGASFWNRRFLTSQSPCDQEAGNMHTAHTHTRGFGDGRVRNLPSGCLVKD